ncbi:ABC transporter permease [Agrobacterium vitis]|uniref:ABC transporter permease n=1 Tax=Rhizobium/Agrobacterium group TaxID=227290 RepID=UPI0008DC29EB|nr:MULTISPECIES: ABC transporter permease [Rhizobium/Agrobacterium group]MCF1432303.1 ABC transporter permease [Allorhizobium ampelinum]MUO88161.1 ABC transporter permease [Agrobacterium vitis]MUZ50710.1 ABC transporter permease [Agrobacterium vitis]MUZ90962.1 ABC transporter permease [Agrobacterium vitis]MVA38909.1 ABC transporter permease [Agrobacterium vitis]
MKNATDITMTTVRSAVTPGRLDMQGFFLRYGLFLLLVLLILLFAWLRPSFVSGGNINDMLRSASIAALMFLGLTWIIAAGEIDVSFMSVAALANMVVAALVAAGQGWTMACLAGLLVGLVFGLVNGLLVAIFKLPALVITIATGGLAGSIAAAIGLGTSISLSSTGFVGSLLHVNFGIIPLLTVIVALLYAGAWFIQERLTFGHYLYAMEQNRAAVIETGVPVNRLLLMLYVLSGLVSALAGILLTADLSSGQPYIGSSYFIDGLTSVLLGGMALKYGKPNVIGTVTAVLLLATLLSGAALLGWTDAQRQIVRGLLLLCGVATVVWARRKTRAHI